MKKKNLIISEIDLSEIKKIREELPLLKIKGKISTKLLKNNYSNLANLFSK